MSVWDSFKEEVRSGKFAVYGQWAAIITGIIIFATGIANLFNFSKAGAIVFAVVSVVLGVIVLSLEIPLFMKCFREGGPLRNFLQTASKPLYRTIFYIACAVLYWVVQLSEFVVSAVFLSITGIFYLIALLKKEDPTSSYFFTKWICSIDGYVMKPDSLFS
ncbi:hypothetical protein ROZALSC1DRAFT_28860 [Rozella allomycis CSF55]|uniref:Golgi apparatus membrane protein TVP18 n=1 Tax=Rozella allomycis (strain CSF55) TaxID=988480 RepID=A0A4P9YJ00_ROZAC|nr:hypothetical protein ROZALSC1DRAFT_28860 [Rozella allomycis CSF55]